MPVWHAPSIYPGAVLPCLTGGAWSARLWLLRWGSGRQARAARACKPPCHCQPNRRQ